MRFDTFVPIRFSKEKKEVLEKHNNRIVPYVSRLYQPLYSNAASSLLSYIHFP